MIVLQVCSYAAPYEGNFMKSLAALERALNEKGHRVYYAFPEKAVETLWCRSLRQRTKVFFLPFNGSRINHKADTALKKIVKDENVGLIHSHFELYDIACKKAAGDHTKVFWHLHDHIAKAKRPYKNWIVKRQYSHYGKGVTLLSVCEHYKNIAVSLGFDPKAAKTVLNGIDLSRISYPYPDKEKEYDFLTFGWDFYRKGVDVILNVMKRLKAEGYPFRFLLNCNDAAKPTISKYLNGETPAWLTLGEQVEDINTLYGNASVFIQASRRETFCYAACEAAYAGMDVVSSDIEGLEWAHTVPSVTFFESGNEEQLYALLKQRLNEKTTLPSSVIDASRNVIEQNYSVDVWVEHILKEYGI